MGDFNPQEAVACDTETTGLLRYKGQRAFAIALCDEGGETWYCEWYVDPCTREVYPKPEDIEFLKKYLENPKLAKVFHNAKFDIGMLEKIGIDLNPSVHEIHDTHIMARSANNVEFTLGLKPLAKKYLGIPSSDEADLKKAVQDARRRAKEYNKHLEEGDEAILLGEEPEMDYWLPRYYDPSNDLCEKYCRQDTFRTMGLFLKYCQVFSKDQDLYHNYQHEMFELWPEVKNMEDRGMRIDRDMVLSMKSKAEADIQHAYDKMIGIIVNMDLQPFDKPTSVVLFNPSSSKQIARILYLPVGQGGLGLASKKVTDKGSLSTDKNALRELQHEEFVRHLIAYRAGEQVLKLFFEKYLELMTPCPITGEMILYPGLNQCGTVTFRFSSSNPNLQQVGNPKTAHNVVTSYHPRAPFGPRKGYRWYAFDFAQQELRLFASISQNPFLLREIREGRDPNTSCANKAWGGKGNPAAMKAGALALDLNREIPTNEKVAEVWKQYGWNDTKSVRLGGQSTEAAMIVEDWLSKFNYEIVAAEKSIERSNSRGRAKNVVFAKIYGGGATSVMELLYCTEKEAREFLREYDIVMPEVNVYMNEMIRKAKKDGYIINPYGRKLWVEEGFEYRAVNYMIQSTAATQMKDCIIRASKYLRKTGLDAHVLMTIHDELLFEIKEEHCHKWLIRGLVTLMEDTGGRIDIPTPVEPKRIRVSWDSKEDVKL